MENELIKLELDKMQELVSGLSQPSTLKDKAYRGLFLVMMAKSHFKKTLSMKQRREFNRLSDYFYWKGLKEELKEEEQEGLYYKRHDFMKAEIKKLEAKRGFK